MRYNQAVYNEILSPIDQVEWNNVIAERKVNGIVIVHSVFPWKVEAMQYQHMQPFNEQITRAIENETAVAASDASTKDGVMSGCWIIIDEQNQNELKKVLYHKN